jgi:single-strand DNA-binding protein
MSGETTITIVGNLTDEPELRFTNSGTAVASFTVASTPRVRDRESGSWRDGDTLFLRCTLWRQAAENAAASLGKGSRVILSGRLRQRSYDTPGGERRTLVEVEVDELGASLRHATATVTKNTPSGAEPGQPAA